MLKRKMIVIQSDYNVYVYLCRIKYSLFFVQRTLMPTIPAGSPLFKLTFHIKYNT